MYYTKNKKFIKMRTEQAMEVRGNVIIRKKYGGFYDEWRRYKNRSES